MSAVELLLSPVDIQHTGLAKPGLCKNVPACQQVPDWQGRALSQPCRVMVDGQAAHLIQQPVQSLLVGPMQLLRLSQYLVQQQPLPDSAPLEPVCSYLFVCCSTNPPGHACCSVDQCLQNAQECPFLSSAAAEL